MSNRNIPITLYAFQVGIILVPKVHLHPQCADDYAYYAEQVADELEEVPVPRRETTSLQDSKVDRL